jgi:hypothetical protein
MKTPFCFFLFIIFLVAILNATVLGQDSFYYFHGTKIPVTISQNKICIKFGFAVMPTQIRAILADEPVLDAWSAAKLAGEENFYAIRLTSSTDIKQLLQRLQNKQQIEIANPVYWVRGNEAIPTDRFMVQFRPSVNSAAINALNKQYHIEVVGVSPVESNLYTFRITEATELSLLEMAQLYYEKLPAAWSTPDFIRPVKRTGIPNDTYFSKQYYFHNANDVDIDAPESWELSTGNSSIVVAVIDDGGETHEDLPANRVVAGYDYVESDAVPSPDGNESHGMAVAGILAATQNNSKGISGLAPDCKVMFLRIFDKLGNPVADSKFAEAIDFAWMNGAHVINNSWTYSSSDPNEVPAISDAIERALTQGRNGKGSVVVFSAGIGGPVQFPANRPNVLAVGAINQSNSVWYYSPRGAELSVVAPSGDVPSLGNLDPCNAGMTNGEFLQNGDVWSLDRPGLFGWNPGDYRVCTVPYYYHQYIWTPPSGVQPSNDYTAKFSGTSATAPQVSGVAALILSVNSGLMAKPTSPMVQCIIKETADHPNGPGNFDTNYGYGRLNAYAAVQRALNPTGVHDPPPNPTGLVITNPGSIGQNPILTWNGSSDADYYHVYRRVSFDPDWLFMGMAGSTSYTDNTLTIKSQNDPMADEFFYQVKAVNTAGESGPSNDASVWGFSFHKTVGDGTDIPGTFELGQNHPNPFNPETEFRYALPSAGYVELMITNLLGQTVRTLVAENQPAGRYRKV